MQSQDTPIKTIVKTIKQRYRWKDEDIKNIIEKGQKILAEAEQLKVNNIFKKSYYEIPTSIPRKLRHLGAITLEDITKKENYKNEFIKYCDLLYTGLGTETSIDKERIVKMQSEIKLYKNQVLNYTKKPQGGTRKVLNKKIKVNLLSEEIYDFLSESDITNTHDFDDLENSEEYDKYITITKEATFRLKGEFKEYSFKILEDLLEDKVYTIMISSESELQVIELENVEVAVKHLMKAINLSDERLLTHIERSYELDYICDDDTVKKVTVSYDTMTSFGEKITALLS